jgi:uncharacterized protein
MEGKGGREAIAVLGASSNPERYSNRAVLLLLEKGYQVIPVNPAMPDIAGLPPVATLSDIRVAVDTVTLYVNASISSAQEGGLLRLRPRRVIFNPGSENRGLRIKLEAAGVETVEACTLVMLKLGRF